MRLKDSPISAHSWWRIGSTILDEIPTDISRKAGHTYLYSNYCTIIGQTRGTREVRTISRRETYVEGQGLLHRDPGCLGSVGKY